MAALCTDAWTGCAAKPPPSAPAATASGAAPPPPPTITITDELPTRPAAWILPVLTYVRTIPAHFSGVMTSAFTHDGTRLLTGSYDATVKIWNAHTGEAIAALPGHTGPVSTVRVTPDDHFAVTAGDQTVRVWTLPEGQPVRTIHADGHQVYSLDVSPDGRILVSGGSDGSAKVWSMSGAPLATLAHGGARIMSVAFSPDGTRVLTAGDDGTIKIWQTADWTLSRTLAGHTATVDQAVFAPDGQTIASASDDHSVRLWHAQNGVAMATLSLHTDEVWSLAISHDGSTLVTGGKDAVLGVWSLPSSVLETKWGLDGSRQTTSLAFAPDGSTLATTYRSGNVDLWRVSKGGTHLPMPSPQIAATVMLAGGTDEERVYRRAMQLAESNEEDRHALDQAEDLLQGVLKAHPKSALAYAGLARIAYLGGFIRTDTYTPESLTKAGELADKAIQINPRLPDAYCVRGWVAFESKDPAGARTALAEALKLAPTIPRALFLSAHLSNDNSDYDAAEQTVRKLFSVPVSKASAIAALEILGVTYWHLGDFDADEQTYRRIIELDPKSAWAKGNFAEFLIYKGDYDGAIEMVRQALSLSSYGVAKNTLANADCMKGEALLWDRGDAYGASALFQEAHVSFSGNARAVYDLGAIHQYLGVTRSDPSEINLAKTWYRTAVAIDPTDPNEALYKSALAAVGG